MAESSHEKCRAGYPAPESASESESESESVSVSKSVSRSASQSGSLSRDHWWRALFDAAEEAQLVCGQGGRILELNNSAAQMLARKSDALGAFGVEDFLTTSTASTIDGYLRGGETRQLTLDSVTVTAAGAEPAVRMVDLAVTPLDRDHWLLTIKDASRRWRMESHVMRLVTAVDSTPDVIYLTDADFRLSFVNAAFQTATGYSIEEAIGRPATCLQNPGDDDAGPNLEPLEAARAGRDWRGELMNRRADGTTYPVETSMSPIYDRRGRFIGCAAFERDISEQKRLETALRAEHDFVVSIMNSLDAAVYCLDRDLTLRHFNEVWKRMPARHGWLEFNREPATGAALLDFVPEMEKRDELSNLFNRVLSNAKAHEVRISSDDGNHWLIRISPWLDAGAVQGLIYMVTDQTRFHRLQQQLYQSQKMETIGALAAGVAHDFNNLLQAIRGNAGLLLASDKIDDNWLRRVQQIEQAANRAADITQQLLSFSRASEEKDAVVDFNQVMIEASSLAQRSLNNRIELHLEPADESLPVRLDPTRASQMLLNLCVNAQDAMPHGGSLTIRNREVRITEDQATKAKSAAGSPFVVCSVIDTGTGIPAELVGRIFDPFFTTKEKGKGTGLGLSIVHDFLSQAGGFLEVESVVGKGTTFHLFLPKVKGGVAVEPTRSDTPLPRGAGRILVVDDQDLVLDFIRTFLSAAGYEIMVAGSAEEALELLGEMSEPIDLLFTDYNMSGQNGYQLIEEVAAQWPDTRFVLASGYLEENERIQIESRHGVRILNKPFNVREASDLIARLLPEKTNR